MQKRSVSLVLGSGGARGLAHIGVICYLEEKGYEIKSISGCSMGALIGGFYAAGKLDDYADWLIELDTFGMVKLLDFKGSGGLVSGETLMSEMKKLIGEHQIESLPIKYTAIASDVKAEKEVWINHGSLLEAIRASISLPLFFTPYHLHGRDLIDGGVLNPVPIAPTFNDKTDLTIAVNLGGDIDVSLTEVVEDEVDSFHEKVIEYLKDVAIPDTFTSRNSMIKIADQSFDAMQGTIARMKLSAYPPDIEIEIPRNLCGTLEFTRAQEMIDYGYEKCKKVFG
ncbi:patatin-like phospholipase family protein [Sulfurovum sp. CS9]|uniref:patatin-like phospholipase family protein n=1 Tax=Sulfurovum sp. CS9 TaxID=3391146 RepID=UPI0039E7312B